MYYITLIILFLLQNIIFCSSGPSVLAVRVNSTFFFIEPRNDGVLPDDVYVSGGPGALVKETYDSYYRSLSETESSNDDKLCMLIKQPLFAQLCVQASKASINQQPFCDLLNKIRAGTIDKNAGTMHLTEKDTNHRLLSYIPKGDIHLLINNKKARLELYAKRESISSRPTVDCDSDIIPSFKLGKSYAGRISRPTEEIEIAVSYNFESDHEHHAKIIAEFDALLMPHCYLAELPIDLQNYIASFLEFPQSETDEEFVGRTTLHGLFKEGEHYGQLFKEHELLALQLSNKASSSISGVRLVPLCTYSIDLSKLISLERIFEEQDIFHMNCTPIITITDTYTEKSFNSTRWTEYMKRDAKWIVHIAFSRNGKKCAQLRKSPILSSELREEQKAFNDYWLLVKKINSDRIQRFLIPNNYNNFMSIGFNKQGTKMIVRAREDGMWDTIPAEKRPDSFHYIVQLSQVDEQEEVYQKTLQEYLKQIVCCKNITNSLNDITMQ